MVMSHLAGAMIGLPQRALVDVTPNYRARAATQRAFFLFGTVRVAADGQDGRTGLWLGPNLLILPDA